MKHKLQTLKPRLQELPPRIRPLPPLRKKANPTGRDADPRRTLSLTSGAWLRLRNWILSQEPLCRVCSAPATDVDHISGDPSDNRRDNLQGLCHACHSKKTAEDHGKRARWGCDAQGRPLDPSHPWNQKSQATDPVRPAVQPCFTADCLNNRQ